MKINWGTAIAIFYAVFVIALLSIVIKSIRSGVDLVETDYYKKDLEYETFRKKKQKQSELTGKIELIYSSESKKVSLIFPQELKNIRGKVVFYRPSNSKLDRSYELKIDASNQMQINVEKLVRGLWEIQIDYTSKSQNYYYEQNLTL